MEKPDELDPAWVRRAIEASGAGRVLGSGWRLLGVRSARERRAVWEVEANGRSLMARIATGTGDRDRLLMEERLSAFLDFLPVEVPQMTVHSAPGGVAIALRPKIEGETATREMFEGQFSERERETFVADVVGLLQRLHATPLEAACRGLGIPVLAQAEAAAEIGCARWFDAARIEQVTAEWRAASPQLQVLWEEIRNWFEDYRTDPRDMVLGHGDLHGGNLIVARAADGFRLVGIVDFENAGIVNLYDEFLRIYLMDVTMGRRIVQTYNQRPGLARAVSAPVTSRFYCAFLFFLLHTSTVEAYSAHVVRMLEACTLEG